MGFDHEEVEKLYNIALVHDVGKKIGIPERILNKEQGLTDEEFAEMKNHTVIGGEILKDIKSIKDIDNGILFHHENYDGTGYPFGKRGGHTIGSKNYSYCRCL